MAEQQLFPTFYIANWNCKGTCSAANRDTVYKDHLRECKQQSRLPDLVFIQELTFNMEKIKAIQTEVLQEELYDGVIEQNSTANQYNCVLYNKNKFSKENFYDELVEADRYVGKIYPPRYYKTDSLSKLKKHMSLAALSVKDHRKPKIIAVSIHNIYKGNTLEMYDMLMTLLCQLNKCTGIPVLLAGDFNMEVGDKLTRYPLTEHRKGRPLIDTIYLIDPQKKFRLYDVKAHMITIPETYDHTETKDESKEGIIQRFPEHKADKWWIRNMAAREEVSIHDPLTATLVPSLGTFSVFSWNAESSRYKKHQDVLKQLLKEGLLKEYDLVFLQDIPDDLEYHDGEIYHPVCSAVNGNSRNLVLFNKRTFELNMQTWDWLTVADANMNLKIKFNEQFKECKTQSDTKAITEEFKKNYRTNKKTAVTKFINRIKDENFQHELRRLKEDQQWMEDHELPIKSQRHFASAILHRKSQNESIIAVSFLNSNKKPERILNVLLHLLRELCILTGYPVVLAGDFKMDVSIVKIPWLSAYNPQPYRQTKRREGKTRVDHVMLWDPSDVTWSLDKVTPHNIKILRQGAHNEDHALKEVIPMFRDIIRKEFPDIDSEEQDSVSTSLDESVKHHLRLALEHTAQDHVISTHDPLTTTIKLWPTYV
jgi:endonuclease/exonuclease/phosphatase family metal-dependent hydrolase